jgi:predicted O-linked N-acetylglucosamine transferase (SPINDLY family)
MRNISATSPDAEVWQSQVQRCCANGDLPGALCVALGAVAADADDLTALHTLAVLYLAAGRATDAVRAFQLLLQQDVHADRYFDLGVALEAAGDLLAARAVYQQALELEPAHFKARLNLCALLLMLRFPDCALREAELLVEYHSLIPEAWCSLGHARFANIKPVAADVAFARAQSLDAGNLPAAFGRVVSQVMCGELKSAMNLLAELKARQLPHAVLSAIPQSRETLALTQDDCEDIFLTALFERYRRGEWECRALLARGLGQLANAVSDNPARSVQSAQAFHALAIGIDYADYRILARRLAAQGAKAVQSIVRRTPAPSANTPGRRLNLGFISPTFRDHPSAYMVRSMFGCHDRSRFSITGYCLGADDGSEVRQEIIDGCDRFVSLATLNDHEAAQRIHDDGIDLLVQFEGFLDGTRNGILMRHPAPIQVAHIGVVGTLAATYVDYRFCDAITGQFDISGVSSGAESVEKCVRLSEMYLPYGAPIAPWSIPVARRDFGLPENAFVFCSFNNDFKISEEVFLSWLEILKATPGSVLWLRATNEGLWNRCLSTAANHRVALERIIRAQDYANNRHLARLRLADLFLDTFDCNAHTTALDALWMGLPVVTRKGQAPASSLCASALQALGMNELVTLTTDAYIAAATALGSEPARCQAVTRKLMTARSESSLFNISNKVKLYESAYETMWARHLAGLPPADFDVLPLGA